MEDRNARSQDNNQDEIINHLQEKIRSQTQRLRNLDQYKSLCEQRISEIIPGHSFPVKPEDLGSGLPLQHIQELNIAKQKISKLEQQLQQQYLKRPNLDNYNFPSPSFQLTLSQLQELYSTIYYHHYELIKEKTAIEESLRSEILNCEEQRVYIEVLKQALESNLEEIGITGKNIEEIINRRQGNKVKSEGEIKNLNNLLKIKTEECEKLINEKNDEDAHLENAASALQYAEEEVQRLEEEKAALLEYIEEHSAKENNLFNDIENIKRESNEFERKNQHLLKEIENEKSHRAELERDLDNIKNESSRAEKTFRESHETEIINIQSQVKQIVMKNESLQANNIKLSQQLKETQEELNTLRLEYDKSIKEISTMKKNLSINEYKAEEIEKSSQLILEKNKKIVNKLEKTEKALQEYKEIKLKEVETQYKNLQNDTNNEIKILQVEIESHISKEKDLIKENNELKKKIQKNQEEYLKLKENSNSSAQELLELKKNLDSSYLEIQHINFERDKLQSDYQRIEFNLNSEKTSHILLQEEYSLLNEKVEKNLSTIKGLIENNREREYRLKSSASEIENLKKNLSISLKDIESERQLKNQYYEDAVKLKKIQIALASSGEQIEECKKLIKNFSSNFGAVSSASNFYNSIVSSQFKDIIFKSNDPEQILLPK